MTVFLSWLECGRAYWCQWVVMVWMGVVHQGIHLHIKYLSAYYLFDLNFIFQLSHCLFYRFSVSLLVYFGFEMTNCRVWMT